MDLEKQRIIQDLFFIGKEYLDVSNFMIDFAAFALDKKISYKIRYRNKTCGSVKCCDTQCVFNISARVVTKTGLCTIRKCCANQTCSVKNEIKLQMPNATNEILKNIDVTNLKPAGFMRKALVDFGIQISYQSAWAAIQNNKIKTFQKIIDGHSFLNSLSTNIIENGDACEIQLSNENKFERVFVSWSASKIFFSNSRKLLYLDGTFLSGPNKGTLLLAVGQDGNDKTIILGMAIVESENRSSWEWFLFLLKRHLDLDHKEVVLMSDRDKGLVVVIESIFKNATKSNCALHISRNLKIRFKSQELMNLFWKSVHTYDLKRCDKILYEIKNLNENFFLAMENANFETYLNSKFPVSRYQKITSNPVESSNSASKKFSDKDIITFIISINNYNMTKHLERSTEKFNNSILPSIQNKINQNITRGSIMSIKKSTDAIFLVDHSAIVNTEEKSCTCKLFQELGFPCVHAGAIIKQYGFNPETLVVNCYKKRYHEKAYNDVIKPISAVNLEKNYLLPPECKRSRGRLKKRRFIYPSENK